MFFERLEVSEAYRSSPSLAKRLMFVDQRRSRRPEGHGRGSWMLGHGRFDRFAAVLAPEGASATRVSSSIRFDSGRPERPPNMFRLPGETHVMKRGVTCFCRERPVEGIRLDARRAGFHGGCHAREIVTVYLAPFSPVYGPNDSPRTTSATFSGLAVCSPKNSACPATSVY